MAHRRRARLLILLTWPLVAAASLAACSSPGPRTLSAARSSTTLSRSKATTTSVPETTTSTAPETTVSNAPTTTTNSSAFSSVIDPVDAQQLAATWHEGCPVDPSELRLLQLSYWGFDGAPHLGTIVVNASVVSSVVQVFETLYAARFPIEEMVPEAEYGGDDNTAAAADDTSGFNCRYAVAPGPPQWSVHAYGEAIDVNDVQNPYIDGSTIIPPAGESYENRSDLRPGMAVQGGTLVEAFAAVGWQWGGRWTSSPDYQHFSSTGG